MTEVPLWYVEHGIANGHPTERVIRALQFLAVGHGYICHSFAVCHVSVLICTWKEEM
jgi:hypothetical protein